MLQQTQVKRVLEFYVEFTRHFPTVENLASASLSSVLRAWQGLGYNRRAKYLHEAAKQIVALHDGEVPRAYEDLRALPGVGDYTAKAVRTFSWNELEIFIETNIRAAFIHHFFSRRSDVKDIELVEVLKCVLPKGNPREWYFALMDYGAYLKKTTGNASRRSAHHIRQKPFKGSDREIRGAILRTLSKKNLSLQELSLLPFEKKRIRIQLAALLHEELITKRGNTYRLAD